MNGLKWYSSNLNFFEPCPTQGRHHLALPLSIAASASLPVILPIILSITLLFAMSVWLPQAVLAQSEDVNLIPIGTLQGDGPASAFVDQEVATWGMVTGVTGDGFYLQDPIGDGDPLTSDGIFAFTYSAPTVTVGECVQVEGEIDEYYAKTELNWISAITPSPACNTMVVTPAPLPPLRPGDDAVAVLEAFEGMVVHLEPMIGFVQGPTKLFSSGEKEIAFVSMQWQRYFGPVHLGQGTPETSALLFLSSDLGADFPEVGWGDRLQIGDQGLTGVLDYNFGKYQLLPLPDQIITALAPAVEDAPESTLPPMAADEYGVCSLNLHGLGQGEAQFPNAQAYTAALSQRAEVIAKQLAGCTVIALQETGRPADAEALAATLLAEHGLAYRALALEGPGSFEAEFPLTNSLLVDEARVTVELVDSVVACSSVDYGVVPSGVCPLGEYEVFDRPPLMAQLQVDGPPDARWQTPATIWVINNHWKSKSGDEEANARLRAAQAQAVADRVLAIQSVDPDAQIVVLGDLNDFYEGAAVTLLQEATGLLHAYEWLPPLDRYTYIFNGAAQVLDHLLMTPNLAHQVASVDILHIHADRPTGDSSLAKSDHDPIRLRLRPAGAVVVGGSLGWGEIAVSVMADGGETLGQTVTDAHGEFRLWDVPVTAAALEFALPSWLVLDDSTVELELANGTAEELSSDVPLNLMLLEMPKPRHETAITGAWLALNTPWLVETLNSQAISEP